MNGMQTEAVTGEGTSKQESVNEEQPFLDDTLVIVLVGSEKYRFEIHKALVCDQSDFFKAASPIVLPEQDPRTFKYFVHWLYTGSLRGFHYSKRINLSFLKQLTDRVRSEVASQELLHADQLDFLNKHRVLWEYANYCDLPFASLVALYILADVLQIPRLKDASITALIEIYGLNSTKKSDWKTFWVNDMPEDVEGPMKGLNMAWETLPKESKLCQLLTHLFCDSAVGITGGEDFHPEHVLAVCNLYAVRWQDDLPKNDWTKPGAICSYHEHEGASCDLTEKYLEDRRAMARG